MCWFVLYTSLERFLKDVSGMAESYSCSGLNMYLADIDACDPVIHQSGGLLGTEAHPTRLQMG